MTVGRGLAYGGDLPLCGIKLRKHVVTLSLHTTLNLINFISTHSQVRAGETLIVRARSLR